MKRYQVIYVKNGTPIARWINSTSEAHKLAENLRKVGYDVDVWERTKSSARKTNM